MKAKIMEERRNPVLKRRELLVEVAHDEIGTPERIALKKFLAAQFDEKPENLYLIKIEGKTGSDRSFCNVQIYETKDLAEKILPEHIITRNLPPEERKPKKKQEVKPPEEKREKVTKPPEEKKEKAAEKTQPKEPEKPKETEKTKK